MERPEGQVIVRVLAYVLQRLVGTGDKMGAETVPVTKFHAMRPPNISVGDYLERIYKYASCSAEVFVLALVYVDRLIQRNNFVVNSLNVHRVVITSVMLGAKFFDDQYYNNAYYARVGGVPCVEMNALELDFLFAVNFSLHVTTENFTKYYLMMHNYAVLLSIPQQLPSNVALFPDQAVRYTFTPPAVADEVADAAAAAAPAVAVAAAAAAASLATHPAGHPAAAVAAEGDPMDADA